MSGAARGGAPVATLRLQLEPRFTLHDAAAHVGHFASLGITHLYLSPILQASSTTPGWPRTSVVRRVCVPSWRPRTRKGSASSWTSSPTT